MVRRGAEHSMLGGELDRRGLGDEAGEECMIRKLTLRDVGPTRLLEFDLAERLNVITGNNGLGKTFVLDTIWWALTGGWAGERALPWRPRQMLGDEAAQPPVEPWITAEFGDGLTPARARLDGRFDRTKQRWRRATNVEAADQSLVIYARVDGRFAVWDALYAHSDDTPELVLSQGEVWNGKVVSSAKKGEERTAIQGLLADWVSWQKAGAPEFEVLRRVLDALGTDEEPLVLGKPARVLLTDRRDIPTLDTAHGSVPVTVASAGIRRVLALAYLLVWAWHEHRRAVELTGSASTRDIVLLVDEPELHLHPSWQRVFLPSVLRAMSLVAPDAAVQLVSATHSPLVLASLESVFREEVDDLVVLRADGSLIRAIEQPFDKQGDAVGWLQSEAFGGIGGRSPAAERAVAAAQAFMAARDAEARASLDRLVRLLNAPGEDLALPPALVEGMLPERVHAALALTLPGHDEFWAHWSLVYHPKHGLRGGR